MSKSRQSVIILMADDDPEDREMTREALEEARVLNEIRFVTDGQDLLDYLYHEGAYSDPASAPRPGLILLDLNMPKVDGRQALEKIKKDKDLRMIPVVVLTTSKQEEDIVRSYAEGANSFVSKPVTFDGLVDAMAALGKYWVEIVDLPPEK